MKVDRRKMVAMMGTMSLGLVSAAAPAVARQEHRELKTITFPTLQDAKRSKDITDELIVQTLGYHNVGDGGGCRYYVSSQFQTETANNGDVMLFGKYIGRMISPSAINYRMFGALGDGKNDDGVQMKLAHEYANRQGIPVINYSGEFWIESTRGIPIQTNTQLGNTIFHINESLNTKRAVFEVASQSKPINIDLDGDTKAKVIAAVKPGVQQLPELKDYKNCLIFIVDTEDRIGFRSGARYKGQSWAREDFFYLEEDGRVMGDIAWSFQDYTSLMAYPCEESHLLIEGGTFFLSGDNHPEPEKKGYFQNGFSVTRSRTIICNQWVGLESGKQDIAYNPRNGFYNFNRVYDVTLENIRLIPWEQDREGTDRDLYAGTYGIGGNRMLNSTFRNVTAEGSMLHWGVFGTNLNKDFRIEKCQLNRVDVHFHCWNLTILDSKIGNRGISITGGGDLTIQNTTCESRSFVNFRQDFGGKWEGNVYINNCRLKPNVNTATEILRFVAADSDYRYPIGLAEKIHVSNFVVDFTSVPNNTAECWLIRTSAFSETQHGERLFFPSSLVCRDITVKQREKGLRLIKIVSPETYRLTRSGGDKNGFLQSNSTIVFKNLQLEQINEEDVFHLQFSGVQSDRYNDNSLYPDIHFSFCDGLKVDLAGAAANVWVDKSIITKLTTGTEQILGEITFNSSRFVPELAEARTPSYLQAKYGANFINCTFHLPRQNGELIPELSLMEHILKINEYVRYNHVNSRLGTDIREYLQQNAVALKDDFMRNLQSNYEI